MSQAARALSEADVRLLLNATLSNRQPERDRAMVLLSFKSGLRACEIAGLTWCMVLRPDGSLGQELRIANAIAKYSSGRRIPMHNELRAVLSRLHRQEDRPRDGPVIKSERGGHLTPHSVVNWFRRIYAALNFDGCSSHSGRRTFITRSARLLSRSGGSLKDIQELVGHRSLTTTERYIAGDRDAQRKLVSLI